MRTDWNEFEQDKGGIFRTLLGMLIFLLRTRPHIAFAVNTLATRCAGATLRDLDAIQPRGYSLSEVHSSSRAFLQPC